LLEQLQIVNNDVIIEKVVISFQHGGLNNSLDAMIEVVNEYGQGRTQIQSLSEKQKKLTAETSGQISLRELWSRKLKEV